MTTISHDKRKNAPSPLHALFDFTDEDLAENRLWQLSPRQQRRLQRTGIVYKYSGPLFLYSFQSGRNGPFYRFTIQDQEFAISKKALLIFKNGASYTLYMERDTRTILSVELISPASAALSAKKLYDALGMESDDLPANRQGLLSRSQRRRLRDNNLGSFFLFLVILLMPSLAFIFTGILAQTPLCIAIPMALIGLGIAFIVGRYCLVPFVQIRRGIVLVKEGLPVREVREFTQDRVTIKDKTFAVSTNVMLTFNPDMVHRVYYTPITNTIVAVERVDPAT